MATTSTTLRSNEVNHVVLQAYDPNNSATMEAAALHRLQAQLPAAHVASVVIDIQATPHHQALVLKFTVTSTNQLQPPEVKAALR